MRFKIDENLPLQAAELLRTAGHDAATVLEQQMGGTDDATLSEVCRHEGRALVTLDAGFADIRSYPPRDYPGIMVLRPESQSREAIVSLLDGVLGLLDREALERKLWIVEEGRVRIRD